MKTTKTKEPKAPKNYNNLLKKICSLASVAFIVATSYAAMYAFFADHLTNVPDYAPHAVAGVVLVGFVSVAFCFNNCNDK